MNLRMVLSQMSAPIKNGKVWLCVLLTAAVLQSCQDDTENILKSRRELLSQSTWRVTKVLVDNVQSPDVDAALVGLRANFSTSGTYSFSKNGTRTGVWRFSSDVQAILFDSVSQTSDTWLILTLESKTFEASYRENNETIQLFLSPN